MLNQEVRAKAGRASADSAARAHFDGELGMGPPSVPAN